MQQPYGIGCIDTHTFQNNTAQLQHKFWAQKACNINTVPG